jgi:phosphate butyryltransferase
MRSHSVRYGCFAVNRRLQNTEPLFFKRKGGGSMIQTFDQLLAHVANLPPRRVAVVAPSGSETFASIREAQRILTVSFVLTGDSAMIETGLAMAGADVTRIEVKHSPDTGSALRQAIRAVHEGEADILMKGGVDTATLMKAVLAENDGLRTGRLLSDVFVLEYPRREGNTFIMITDGGITPAPDLKNKVELIINAVQVAHALGNLMPRVAVLSATEFVVPGMQSTLDAASLAKMCDRGQITGCIVDGPFALDNALSDDAAAEKRIKSEVAGKAEILIAANIEAANGLAKSTTYFAGLRLAHVIVGGKVPILIPSRADKSDAKLLSVALGILMSQHVGR